MDKKRIEEFATTARKQLIQNLTYEASRIGITPTEIQKPTTEAEDIQTFTTGTITNTLYKKQIEQRNQLIEEIQTHSFNEVIEKIAYTWFNRIIAIRFMEINNYLPTHTRVLSSITPGKKEPDIITEALNLDLNYTEEEIQQIYKYKTENQTDKLFKLLFIKQCNKLNEILPELFETIDDYTEILFNIQLSNENNIINKLIETIPEEDFTNQVEIIGWLYQYYNKELKDETYKNIKKQKVGKERIPAVTQLFTPDWIVKYMVENSLGKLWIENHENTELKNNWKYYIDEVKQTEEVLKDLKEYKSKHGDIKPEEIKILDPSMGSGHILVYIFDVLMQIYTTQGYTEKEATTSILQNNIYGIDIDDRAYQLAYFAIMMKARSYDRRILNKNIQPNLLAIEETNTITNELIEKINSNEIAEVIKTFKNGKTLGSITKINRNINLKECYKIIDEFLSKSSMDVSLLNYENELKLIKKVINQTMFLNQKYDIVITNPPYMGNANMDNTLKNYLKKNYPNTKQDLFSVFMEKGFDLVKDNAFNVMVTMQSWMFLSTFEKFRDFLFENSYITTLLHMDNNVMGIAFGTSATIFRKEKLLNYTAKYIYIQENNLDNNKIPYTFPIKNSQNNNISLEKLSKIPSKTISYWIDDKFISIFKNSDKLSDIAHVKQGMDTGNNNNFLRLWYEVNFDKIYFDCFSQDESEISNKKWYPYNKGGSYNKWYGNQNYVVNWYKNGQDIKNNKNSTLRNQKFYFNESISWSKISSGRISFRKYPKGFLFDNIGSSIFTEKYEYYLMGLLNSNVTNHILNLISPTMATTIGNISNIPIIIDENKNTEITELVNENINIVKKDYDNDEISWNFDKHPLLNGENSLKSSFKKYQEYKETQFNLLKNNEIRLNEIFRNIYHEDIDIDIENKYISIRKANYESEMKSFISYAIGCIFGRYSLDKEGLICFGGNLNKKNYIKYIPDEDNIVPILDDEYFEDDIVNRFIEFIKVTFGSSNLDENLDFIAKALNKKGNTNTEIIRNYFINDFFEYHVKMYSVIMRKAPIYWQFDSGKENAFKCLIYMHRYEPDLVSRVRFDYLHKTQRAIEDNIKLQESIINDSDNKSRVNKANKKKTKLIKQLDEIKLYDLALAHVAHQRIEIDLDDGVKVNYAKFQNIEVVDPNTNKTRKINLLKKI